MEELLHYRNKLLVGDKISLRPFTEDDIKLFSKWWNDSTILIGNRARIFGTYVSENIKIFEEWGQNNNNNGFGLSIINKENKTVGSITLFGINHPS